MREITLAVKAILRSWQDGSTLDFRGEFTTHTLMPPTFDPGPNPHGVPPVLVGAVGPRMTRMAAEVADGLIIHPLNSERTIREHTLVHLKEGFGRVQGDRSSFQVISGAIVGVWEDEQTRSSVEQALRSMVAFYASTPAYRPLLDIEGYGGLQPALRDLTKQGRWAETPALVDDGMLDRFTVRGTPTEVGTGLFARYSDLVDRVALSPQGGLSAPGIAQIVAAAR
jgi:probable F420-dependent oxidoreductase